MHLAYGCVAANPYNRLALYDDESADAVPDTRFVLSSQLIRLMLVVVLLVVVAGS